MTKLTKLEINVCLKWLKSPYGSGICPISLSDDEDYNWKCEYDEENPKIRVCSKIFDEEKDPEASYPNLFPIFLGCPCNNYDNKYKSRDQRHLEVRTQVIETLKGNGVDVSEMETS